MSKAKDMARAEAGKPFRNTIPNVRRFTCMHCRMSMPEYLVTEHLVQCQPFGVRCDRCGELVMPEQFLEHWNTSHT